MSMNTTSEATSSPLQNEISSKTLIIYDEAPSLLTINNTNNFEESVCMTDNYDNNARTFSNDKIGLCNKLKIWNVEFNVSHNCLNKLLFILKSEGLDVSKDGRTLMNTPKKHDILSMKPGAYVHFDIKKMITSLLFIV